MLGLMPDWPPRLRRIVAAAAVRHGTRAAVSRAADGSVARTGRTFAARRSPPVATA